MKFLPDPSDDPPDEELTPRQLHDRFEKNTNLDPRLVDDLRASEAFEEYRDAKSGGQPIGEPLDDYERLATTPASEWEDKDDGFNEVEEAEELLDYVDRTAAQGADGQELGDTGVTKQELSLLTWGVDVDPEDEFP